MTGTVGYFERDRPEVAALVPVGSGRVLDVGCGAGRLGARLRAEGRAEIVHGLERDPDAAASAASSLDDIRQIDLESDDLQELLETRAAHYDVMILADVLEHVRDPWRVLADLLRLLRPGGLVIASVPNVRVLSVVGPLLLRGRFEYRDRGVLDRTHLRFFTRASARELLENAGLTVETIVRSKAWWRTGWKAWVGERLGDLGAEQFLIVARAGDAHGDR